jgi:hypothetical protein
LRGEPVEERGSFLRTRLKLKRRWPQRGLSESSPVTDAQERKVVFRYELGMFYPSRLEGAYRSV